MKYVDDRNQKGVVVMMDKKELTVIKELCKENQKFAEIYNDLVTEKCQVLEAANIEFRNRFALIFGNMQLMEANDKNLSENANWMQLADDIKGLHELLEQFSLYITSDKMKSASMNLQILVQEIFHFIGKFDFGDRKKKRTFTEHTLDKLKKGCTCPTIQEKIKKLKNIKTFFSKIVI